MDACHVTVLFYSVASHCEHGRITLCLSTQPAINAEYPKQKFSI